MVPLAHLPARRFPHPTRCQEEVPLRHAFLGVVVAQNDDAAAAQAPRGAVEGGISYMMKRDHLWWLGFVILWASLAGLALTVLIHGWR